MIRRLRIKISITITTVFMALMMVLFISTYMTAKNNLEETCYINLYSAINYTYSSNSYSPVPITSPMAVVTVDYSGNIKLLYNQIPGLKNDDVIDMSQLVLSGSSSKGTLKDNIAYLRRSIGISNIRIAFADTTTDKNYLLEQRNHYIVIGICSFAACLIACVLISRWITLPVEKASISQKQFIANASHELKTPLTVILSDSHMLQESEKITDEKDGDRIRDIVEESNRMRMLIENMLQIAQHDSAMIVSEHEDTDLSQIVNKSVMTYEPYAYDHGKLIECNICDNIHISGNESQLRQLTDILIDNAVKYSDPDTTIHVRLEPCSRGAILLSVKSTGNPVSGEDAQRIFNRFYRTDHSRGKTSGYGLGLSIAMMITQEHGGKIWLETEGSESNVFYVRLPVPALLTPAGQGGSASSKHPSSAQARS